MDINESIKKECLKRRYSLRTIQTYQKCVFSFFQHCNKEAHEVTKKDVREFLENLSEKCTGGTIHVYLNSLKFFFEECLHKNMQINIKYSRRPERLPFVLSKKEVIRLIESIKNPKYNLMISLMYGSGLRVSELLNLKIKDLNIEKNFGFVRAGKGNKDRIFIIPESLKEKIRELINNEDFLGEDNLFLTNRRKKYSIRSLQVIVKDAAKSAGLDYKEIHCHTLRHSFATHLIENGSSVSEVQALLGHKSPETTFVYLHTATPNMIKVKSPLDEL
jgi:site-specific recombinase XerD